MTPSQFAKRQALIAEGKCPRCKLLVSPWPLQRADICHVKGSVVCPRVWENIHAAEDQIRVRMRASWTAHAFGAAQVFPGMDRAQSYIRTLNKQLWAARMFRRCLKAGGAKLSVVVVRSRDRLKA